MHDENPYRIAVLLVFVLTATIGAFHRIRAQSGERLARREEGLVILVTLRVAGLVVWAAMIAYLISPASMAPAAVALPSWLRWTGVATGVAGAALMYSTLTNLGKNLTDTVVTRIEHTLVENGPYRWVRHPFYVTAGLMIVSVSLLSANWAIFLAGATVVVLLVIRTPIEERKLLERFGPEYQAYKDRTGRFFPRLWR